MSRSNDFVRFTSMAKLSSMKNTAIWPPSSRARFQQQEFVHHAFIGPKADRVAKKSRHGAKLAPVRTPAPGLHWDNPKRSPASAYSLEQWVQYAREQIELVQFDSAYYKALQGVRERGMDMTGWLEYFTEGLGAQMRDVQMTAEHVMRKDVILARARKNGLKERPVAILGYLLTAGKATVAECEEELKMNRRTLQRDLKLLVEKGLVREIGTGPTDPTKYYQPLL